MIGDRNGKFNRSIAMSPGVCILCFQCLGQPLYGLKMGRLEFTKELEVIQGNGKMIEKDGHKFDIGLGEVVFLCFSQQNQ